MPGLICELSHRWGKFYYRLICCSVTAAKSKDFWRPADQELKSRVRTWVQYKGLFLCSQREACHIFSYPVTTMIFLPTPAPEFTIFPTPCHPVLKIGSTHHLKSFICTKKQLMQSSHLPSTTNLPWPTSTTGLTSWPRSPSNSFTKSHLWPSVEGERMVW